MTQQVLDSYVDDAVARTRAAKDQGEAETLEKDLAPQSTGVKRWIRRLPKNIGVGLYRAALNTIETMDDVFEAGSPLVPTRLGDRESEDVSPPLQTLFPGVFEAAHDFADEAEQSNTFSDDITQGIAQFVIPFTSYLKALGGIKNIPTLAKAVRLVLAEGFTAASAFEAHEGRVADVVEMGRQMENDFGALLNKVSPHGSLANAYINWMTDRENESQMKGRFKNAVDSLVVTGGIVTVLKATGTALKTSRKLIVTPEKLQIPPNTRFATEVESDVVEAAAKE